MDEQHYEYRTGQTAPRQKHNGIIAFLLILVIFLTGLVSALGFLNVRLFRLLDAQNSTDPLHFSQSGAALSQHPADGMVSVQLWGMTLQEMPAAYQNLHGLPPGLYICHVTPGSQAEQLGISPGDLLTAIGDTAIHSINALPDTPGAPLNITLYKEGNYQQFTLTPEEES